MLTVMLTLTGCNTNRSTENIKIAFDSITALAYEDAITQFDAAEEAMENTGGVF